MVRQGSTGRLGFACPYCGSPIADPHFTNCPNCGGLLQGMSPRVQRPAPEGDWSNAQTVPLAPAAPRAAPRVPRQQPRPRRRGGRGWLGCVVPIVVTLLLLAAAGTAGAYYLFNQVVTSGGSNLPQLPAFLQPTATAAVATVTPLPTATPSPQPTATQPAPTATPAPTLHTLFHDPLMSNTNGWFSDGGNALFEADGYHVRNGYNVFAPVQTPKNLNVSVDAASVKSQPGVYGIIYRAVDDREHEYVFWITEDGYWGVMNARTGPVVASTKTTAIHKGYGVFNHMEVRVSGTYFSFYINGTQVGSANDGAYASGHAGLAVESQGQEAIFKNFRITQSVLG